MRLDGICVRCANKEEKNNHTGIKRKAAAAGRVNQSIEHEDREMAVTVIHCENCDLYYGRSVEKCTYCNRNLVTYRADGKWTKEYFDLDSKAKNGDRNAEGLRRGVVNRSNRELNKGEQEGRHKEHWFGQGYVSMYVMQCNVM